MTVLGQSYVAKVPQSTLTALSDLLASGRLVYVIVSGKVGADGKVRADSLSIRPSDYVPGATRVMLVGKITNVNASLGRAQIGNVLIDYTSSLGTQRVSPSIGAIVAVTGTQAAFGAPVQAEMIQAVAAAK